MLTLFQSEELITRLQQEIADLKQKDSEKIQAYVKYKADWDTRAVAKDNEIRKLKMDVSV